MVSTKKKIEQKARNDFHTSMTMLENVVSDKLTRIDLAGEYGFGNCNENYTSPVHTKICTNEIVRLAKKELKTIPK